ncbi:hypothetical protein A3K42_01640 [candidate division WWE3 bacterium RBG_13_37_7]|uniref:Helix-turn-helix domain-containing protein n=1 Tax=candidate division WWE3 bacterium RBG_13_37_7 TaxID=1802609 RepID=A0A1F4U3Z2_UNCKA|nr:MAG: hypothetical protein A3K42_01640 [candidate division WWE3 bacterium RBG_13_37_7]
MIKLTDKLYTSTEVASILGVSLRSVYRYLEENRLTAEVKTATGRHRFTRQDILNFLYPGGVLDEREANEAPRKYGPTTESVRREEVEERRESRPQEPSSEESVDWLSKFRAAAEKFKATEEDVQEEEPVEPRVEREPVQPVEQAEAYPKTQKDDYETIGFAGYGEEADVEKSNTMFYYRSSLGGLKDIAQSIDKNSRESQLDYAFTLNAGLSLYKPIKPFSLLHSYVRSADQQYFEKLLMLSPSDKENAQLCLMISDDSKVYATREELHGLYVVSKSVLLKDIEKFGSDELKGDAESIL